MQYPPWSKSTTATTQGHDFCFMWRTRRSERTAPPQTWGTGAARSSRARARSLPQPHVPCCLLTVVPAVMVTGMSEITRILSAIEQDDPHAAEQLLPLVYDELRKL